MSHKKLFILLIDDDLPTLKLYQRELNADYHVVICQERTQAEEILQTLHISAVILEPNLSNGEGWNLIATMHLPGKANRFPIILCSSSDEKKRGLEAGATVFLTKPVLPDDLRNTLQRTLTNFRG